jgi:flagellar basal-body rod modification protein FlgD
MVSSVSSTTSSTSSTTSSSTTVMGKDDFLKLMITELKNQDPLNPMDGTQYVAELAQFSSLEQLTNLNEYMKESIDTNSSLAETINNTVLASLIGKEAKVSGSSLTVNGQDSISLGYTLSSAASSVTVNIYDSSGTLVKTIDDCSTTSGDNKLSWDLTDNDGSTVEDGSYTFEVVATDSSGNSMTADLFRTGIISGVRFTTSGTVVLIDGAEYGISDITEVLNSGE